MPERAQVHDRVAFGSSQIRKAQKPTAATTASSRISAEANQSCSLPRSVDFMEFYDTIAAQAATT
jgi:hypothetical protein